MNKKCITVIYYIFLFFFTLSASDNTVRKISVLPLSNKVEVQRVNIINEQNNSLSDYFPDNEYTKLDNGDVIINRLVFIDPKNSKVLYKIDNVEIWKYYSNTDNNIFLIKEKKKEYNLGKCFVYSGRLLLLNFTNGIITEIDDDVLDWCLSEQGDEVSYIKNMDYLSSNILLFGNYKDEKKTYFSIDYSKYVPYNFATPSIVYFNNFLCIELTEEYIPYGLLILDRNGIIKEYCTIKLDKDNKRYYFENKKGELIANYYR